MALEIERKFLVKKGFYPEGQSQIRLSQAYLCAEPERTVRVRIADDKAFITVKGKVSGISRPEYEYQIPVEDAREMMALSVFPPIDKVRHLIYLGDKKWEVDVFEGANAGLILAEIELSNSGEEVDLPEWVADEVSNDIRYHNSQLAQRPYSTW